MLFLRNNELNFQTEDSSLRYFISLGIEVDPANVEAAAALPIFSKCTSWISGFDYLFIF